MAADRFSEMRQAAEAAWTETRLDDAEACFAALRSEFPGRPIGWVGRARLAAARGEWPQAVDAWRECLERFAAIAPLDWSLGKASALARSGRAPEAEAILQSFSEAAPSDPRSLLMLARMAARRGAWDLAAQRFELLLERHPERGEAVDWTIEWAEALGRLGKDASAVDVLRDVLSRRPGDLKAAHLRARLLSRSAGPRAALAETRLGGFEERCDYPLLLWAARMAADTDEMDVLRLLLPRLIGEATNGEQCEAAFSLIPLALEGGERQSAWLNLQRTAQALTDGSAAPESAGLLTVKLRLKLSLRDAAGFLSLFDAERNRLGDPWRRDFVKLAERLRARCFPDYDAPKVFGIGLSRTGTTTLDRALRRLGYLSSHYLNVFTGELLTADDALWFDALSDTPICPDFESLFHQFPNSLFVYTHRSFDDWRLSLEKHYLRQYASADFEALLARATTPGATRYGAGRARSAISLFFRHGDAATARRIYEKRVDEFFSGDRAARLLRFDVFAGEGWEKLCGFLGRPVPSESFPWENAAPDTFPQNYR